MNPLLIHELSRGRKKFRPLLVFFILLLAGLGVHADEPHAAPSPVDALADIPWEQINEKDGVKIFRRLDKNATVVDFKGEGLIEAPLAKVASISFDCTRSKEWVDDEVESRVDHWVGDFDWIEYDHMGTPFIIKDRDFVTRGRGQTDVDGFDLVLTYKSVDDPAIPLTKYVRGTIVHAISGMIDKGASGTYLVMEAEVDPNGSVPKWLVNWVQKSWAFETFTNLRRQAKKADIQIDPFITKLLAGRVSKKSPAPANP